ncbi:hypothetical protein M413DRAFT_14555 [Hebeloma cylindrosporum]|uniref:DUF6532 domain-containing protein n=1 Tax=Hebeloma cylindrosporum TaxID=76867 RepID=A0A0C3BVF3_HEBCY|nr:hypothetical protein M413DRAFT_14555 [Hebeloma cylindrosporum h7]
MAPSASQNIVPPRASRKNISATPATRGSTQQATGPASGRPARKSKTDAYTAAPWVGAAPTGNRKCTASTAEPIDQPSKKVKKGSIPSAPSIPIKPTTASRRGQAQSAPRRKPVRVSLDSDDDENDGDEDVLEVNKGLILSCANFPSAPPKPTKSTTVTRQASRRMPARISCDSDVDNDEEPEDMMDIDESSQHRRRRPTTSNDLENGSEIYGSEGDENPDANSIEDDLSEGNDDLTGLNSAALQKKISSERPQWKNHSIEDPARLFDHEHISDEDYQNANIPDAQCREAGTTASEFDGAPDDDQDEDEGMDGMDDIEGDEKDSKKVLRWKSKRHDTAAAKHRDVNHGWPEEAHYTPVLPKARNLSIREQPLPMRKMIRAAVNHISGSILFDSAYPVAEKVQFETYHRDVFVKCAKRLKYYAIVKRIQRDDELVKLCARVINARISNLRTRCKKVTDGKVEGFYQLLAGEEASKRVKSLTDENQDYIYPINSNGVVNTKRPFFHPCIISSIKEFFFTGSHGTLAQKHEARFSSSISTGPEKDELELPIPMVCIVATTNHASLDDWSQGYKRSKSDFRADAYE